jgi:hypothetical protein
MPYRKVWHGGAGGLYGVATTILAKDGCRLYRAGKMLFLHGKYRYNRQHQYRLPALAMPNPAWGTRQAVFHVIGPSPRRFFAVAAFCAVAVMAGASAGEKQCSFRLFSAGRPPQADPVPAIAKKSI